MQAFRRIAPGVTLNRVFHRPDDPPPRSNPLRPGRRLIQPLRQQDATPYRPRNPLERHAHVCPNGLRGRRFHLRHHLLMHQPRQIGASIDQPMQHLAIIRRILPALGGLGISLQSIRWRKRVHEQNKNTDRNECQGFSNDAIQHRQPHLIEPTDPAERSRLLAQAEACPPPQTPS